MIRFTKEERIILLFLLAALFVGTAVTYHKKLNPGYLQSIEFDEKKIQEFKKININKAGSKELLKIRGIGPVLAERIISYREKYGHFREAEDIKKVKGIGDKTFEKIKKEIILE
ncbi:MAG: helix-hairpin-helix domain-containing protein [Candidatus Omnitrophota bacterium]|nr:MAG: helix-hairpin-helix domain-containing protein [Candidatus Omnitrophota bacterium]